MRWIPPFLWVIIASGSPLSDTDPPRIPCGSAAGSPSFVHRNMPVCASGCILLFRETYTQVSTQCQNVSHMSGRGEGAAWRLTVYNRVFTRNRAALADQRICAYTNMNASTFYTSPRIERWSGLAKGEGVNSLPPQTFTNFV